MAGPLEVRVDAHELTALYQAAKAAPGMVQVELRRGINKAAAPVKQGVQAAASFSTRIPGAVKVKSSFAAKGASVTVSVDAAKAPHAAPINNKGKGGKFRHRVYGQDVWVDQDADPFFATGQRAGTPAALKAMDDVMTAIAHQLGFR